MKLPRHCSGFLAAATLWGAALESSAQLTQTLTNTFGTTNSVVGWNYWFGNNLSDNSPMAWDSTVDAATNPGSGSLKVVLPWTGSGQSGYWYGFFNMDGPVTERVIAMLGPYITNLSFDIHVDPSSPIASAGNFGVVRYGFGEFVFVGALTLPLSASNGWLHVSAPVPADAYPGVLEEFVFAMTNSPGQTSGTTLFWIDNAAIQAAINYTNSFDNAPGPYGTPNVGSSATSWIYQKGVNPADSAMSWASNVDANGSSSSGSLQVTIPWTNGSGNASGVNLSQTMFGTFANRDVMDNGQTTSGSNFQYLYCSVLVSNGSPLNAAGNYGVLQIGFVTDSNGTWNGITWLSGAATLYPNAAAGWTNIVLPIDYTTPGLSNVSGIFLEMQTGAAEGGGLPGTTMLWVDNLGASAGPAAAPAPPSFTSVSQSGAMLILNGSDPGGSSGLDCVILSSTNLSLPISQWTPMATNPLTTNGTFSYTNVMTPSQPAMYFSFIVNVAVTVQANPSGASFTVDGADFTSSHTFGWVPGSSHTLATTSPQSGGTGIQYYWNGWSDTGPISHLITPFTSTTDTVNFTTEYYLTMAAGTGGSVSPASAWENSGAVVPISATDNEGYFLSNWTGIGSGSYSGVLYTNSVTMDGPISETATFTTNVPANISVTVQASPPDVSFSVDGTNYMTAQVLSWVPQSSHTIATTSPQSGATGIQYVWNNWSDGGAISHSVNPVLGTTYTANFATQYYLTMAAGTGGSVSPASGWESSGAVVPIIATSNAGYSFNDWTGSGSGSYSGSSSSNSVTMDGPISETASFTLGPGAASSFTMSTNIGVAPFTVNFTNTSLNSPTSWSWTFGDGGTSTLQNPSHTFTNIWRQTVSLAVTNGSGGSVSSQAVYQCFPCDALYDWTGAPGQVATVASLSNSLVTGGNNIGTFTTTNHDVPSTNLLGIIFTNLPGMTNGCPVVFSNGIIYSNFNTTNALAYSFTNDHEQFTFHFKSGLNITNFVWIFYDTLPSVLNAFAGADEAAISTVNDNPDIGAFWLNRNLGIDGPLLPGAQNINRTTEADSGYMDSPQIWQLPNRLYRLLLQVNTNGTSQFAVEDTVSNTLVGFVTNFNTNEVGLDFAAFCDGHISSEIFITNETCIMGYHDILTINRPLTFSQISNVVMFGP